MMPIPPERICGGRLSAKKVMVADEPSASNGAITATCRIQATSGVRKCAIARKQGSTRWHSSAIGAVIITGLRPSRSLSHPPRGLKIVPQVPATATAPNACAGGRPNVWLAKTFR